jgi:hypothetical protein
VEDLNGSAPPKASSRLQTCGFCAALLVLALIPLGLAAVPVVGTLMGIAAVEKEHEKNRAHMRSPEVSNEAARALALQCQSVTEEISDHANGQAWLPKVVRECHPAYGELGPKGAHFEMHGGFDHYGYDLQKDETASTKTHNKWDLWFYTEQSRTKLCSVVLGVDEKIPLEELIANAVAEYDRLIADDTTDVGIYKAKIMFLLGFKKLDAALATCIDAEVAVPTHWLPRYTAAHLGARLGKLDASAKEFSDWVHANPDYPHFVYLFLFHMREGKTPEALAAIREAIAQPFVETPTAAYNKYYLGCACAVFALSQGDAELAGKVCDRMESSGTIEPYWRGEVSRIRAAVDRKDGAFVAPWVREHGWPNLFNGNSTQPDNASVLYPATWTVPKRAK